MQWNGSFVKRNVCHCCHCFQFAGDVWHFDAETLLCGMYEQWFFPFKITRVIDGRVFGKLCVDDYHLVVDAELVDLAKEQPAELEGEVVGRAVCAYSVGERLWVDVKSDNVDLPFVTVTVH